MPTAEALRSIEKQLERLADAAEALVGIAVGMAQLQLELAKQDDPCNDGPSLMSSAEEQIKKLLAEQKRMRGG